ncbi:uncharacterized protein K489DRAFT_381231 [Dissoconium aciculare CBS 342.82]|uniref:Uncharacterized protein n=1 Tax=Dissoconium aciculare CBS 342.82 TaxID=1314786 RepID=A0A6J3M6H0_9PEZI|nr:uncharacterized protein K489DRAFT_381231 [Dissoconium aciculare CBS 342.82]KAF1822472.1 hypothetical protein K489DRAFT_381231 [Dissoconium aciculare CBS 342.82]
MYSTSKPGAPHATYHTLICQPVRPGDQLYIDVPHKPHACMNGRKDYTTMMSFGSGVPFLATRLGAAMCVVVMIQDSVKLDRGLQPLNKHELTSPSFDMKLSLSD